MTDGFDGQSNLEARGAGKFTSARLPSISIGFGLLALGSQLILLVFCLWADVTGRFLPSFAVNWLLGVEFYASTLGLVAAGASTPAGRRERREQMIGIFACTVGLLLCANPIGLLFWTG